MKRAPIRLASELEAYRALAVNWLAEHTTLRSADILTGKDAWTIAHNAGITRKAYEMGRDITDAHIQTALERIFPNAVFKDAKRY